MKRNTTRSFKIDLKDHEKKYELEMLIREFIKPDLFVLEDNAEDADISLPEGSMDRNAAKRYLYDALAEATGYRPEWGTLTGVRPAKLATEMLYRDGHSEEEVFDIFRKEYYVNEEKAELLLETCRNQSFITSDPAGDKVALYVGIPFCPTRCLYCSFTSNQVGEAEMERYLGALFSEIRAVGSRVRESGAEIESIYFGGGTPTSLSAEMLDRLLGSVCSEFDTEHVREFCVEAGRPDTITAEKLKVLKDHGVDRVSINPQTMNAETLELIGRAHSIADVYTAFDLVRASGIPHVNTDLIAGLPGETPEMFSNTLDQILDLGPDNITVHTLAVKRSSKLHEANQDYNYETDNNVGNIVSDARNRLTDSGYRPYYMYRQKHMLGNYENVGYARPGSESVYNIRIMDEHQTIVALGAGGISKAYYPEENRLERVPNVSNYSIYIDRIDEMIERKNQKLFPSLGKRR